jgi:hypothetical protein
LRSDLRFPSLFWLDCLQFSALLWRCGSAKGRSPGLHLLG